MEKKVGAQSGKPDLDHNASWIKNIPLKIICDLPNHSVTFFSILA